MKLTLVRHGETNENKAGILQGQIPGQLTSQGIRQAHEAAETLRNHHFDVIVSSDLQRCLDTAESIRMVHSTVPFYIDILLRERYGGSMQGGLLADERAMFGADGWYTHRLPGGGESWQDVRDRQALLLHKLYEQYAQASVLVIAHGGSVRGIRSVLENRTLAQIDSEETPNGGIWYVTMHEQLDG